MNVAFNYIKYTLMFVGPILTTQCIWIRTVIIFFITIIIFIVILVLNLNYNIIIQNQSN